MATLGFNDLKNVQVPSLWDLKTIKTIELADGTTFDIVVQQANAVLSVLSAELLAMRHYSNLFAVQQRPELKYAIGVTNGYEVASEYGTPAPRRGARTGHMLPLVKYDRALGWTQMFLRDADMDDIDADLRSLVTDSKKLLQQKLLARHFKMEGETVGTTSNASVPFADGGVTDTTFVPVETDQGNVFTSSHDHFVRQAALNDANLDTNVRNLQEHGHQSPFEVIASDADAASWAALTGFKQPEWAGIVYRATTDRANIGDVSDYFGYVESDWGIARIWLTPRVPTNYYSIYKAYGPGDPRSPLRVRINKNWGWGYKLVPGTYVNAPQLMAVSYNEFGIGIGEDRTNGVCVFISGSGDYITPTIS